MSTAGNLRVTRASSKARSTGAASTGAASVGASNVGRSRRAGSAAPLAEDDKPAVGSQVTRAYGTKGKSAQAQLLSAQIGMNQAVNPIANAVSRAQAPETPIDNTSVGLPALAEEQEPEGSEHGFQPEGSEHGSNPFIDHIRYSIERRPYSIDSYESEPPVQQSFFSRYFWGPHRGGFNAEGPNRTSNNVVEDRTRRNINDPDGPQVNSFPRGSRNHRAIYPKPWVALVRDVLLVLMLLFGLIWYYEASRTSLFEFGEDPKVCKDSSMSSQIIQRLHHRVSKVEQHVQDLSLDSKAVDATAAKHQVNWFTPGLGTAIDVYLSSPTVSECDPTWTPDGWPWSMFKSQTCPQVSLSAPHYAALSPWSDPVDDSWCAPPSNGKLQLTVVLSRTITPTELVIEHATMDEMPVGFMGSSPKEVELWIQISDDTTRAAVREAISLMNPSLLEDSSPQDKTIGDQALPLDYVPVGRWEYDIHTNQRLQTFLVPLSLGHYGVSTNSVAVRANSNWGNIKYTCLGRLRLHGEDTSGITEKLDPPTVKGAPM